MANNLNQEQKVDTKAVLKCENAEQVRTSWQGAFNPPTFTPGNLSQGIYLKAHVRWLIYRNLVALRLL